jgi:predicted O-linked N-acetylglucosamine transferase (SPINDLY family)
MSLDDAVDAIARWEAARGATLWRGLPELERSLGRLALHTTWSLILPVFYTLLLPLPAAVQAQVASLHVAALQAEIQPPRAPFSTMRPARPLSVAVVRGSSNQNADRLAALLAVDRSAFSARLYTTQLAARDIIQLDRALGRPAPHARLHESDDAAAAQLRGCHVAVDACGHTAGGRLALLARRPCAVATAVLGFASSYGGGGLVDYLTVDRVVAAPQLATAASRAPERLAVLPASYQVSPRATEGAISAAATATAATNGGPLIGCFVRAIRLHPSSFGLWADSLRHARHARLALLVEARITRDCMWPRARTHSPRDARAQAELPPLRAELAAAGLAARRLSGRRYTADKAAHLARHRSLALALDTTPLYGAHTRRASRAFLHTPGALVPREAAVSRSAADALLAGVPLLTLPAEAWSSRVAASIALAVGAPHTVAGSHREWLHLARALLGPAQREPLVAAVARPLHRAEAPFAAALHLQTERLRH